MKLLWLLFFLILFLSISLIVSGVFLPNATLTGVGSVLILTILIPSQLLYMRRSSRVRNISIASEADSVRSRASTGPPGLEELKVIPPPVQILPRRPKVPRWHKQGTRELTAILEEDENEAPKTPIPRSLPQFANGRSPMGPVPPPLTPRFIAYRIGPQLQPKPQVRPRAEAIVEAPRSKKAFDVVKSVVNVPVAATTGALAAVTRALVVRPVDAARAGVKSIFSRVPVPSNPPVAAPVPRPRARSQDMPLPPQQRNATIAPNSLVVRQNSGLRRIEPPRQGFFENVKSIFHGGAKAYNVFNAPSQHLKRTPTGLILNTPDADIGPAPNYQQILEEANARPLVQAPMGSMGRARAQAWDHMRGRGGARPSAPAMPKPVQKAPDTRESASKRRASDESRQKPKKVKGWGHLLTRTRAVTTSSGKKRIVAAKRLFGFSEDHYMKVNEGARAETAENETRKGKLKKRGKKRATSQDNDEPKKKVKDLWFWNWR